MKALARKRWLLWIIMGNIAASVLHYLDNLARFHEYPEPQWLSPHLVEAFWFVMTPVALGGYYLYMRERGTVAYLLLYLYGAMSLLVLGHYSYAPLADIPFSIHVFILFEAVAAVCLVLFTAWLQVGAPEGAVALPENHGSA